MTQSLVRKLQSPAVFQLSIRCTSLSKRPEYCSGRNFPPTNAYSQISKVEYDIEPFEDKSREQNRSEPELLSYLASLKSHISKRRGSQPKRPSSSGPELPFQPLYKYTNLETTEIDQRPSYIKFIDDIKQNDSELYEQITEPLQPKELIDMSYLELYETKNAPSVKSDEEYPDWVWTLVPESRQYWWTDLVQTPFENLSELEQIQLLRKWKMTLHLSNKLWMQSTLGKTGKFRPGYKDPWPQPLTKMDIWGKNDPQYEKYAQECKKRYKWKRQIIKEERVRFDDDHIKKHMISSEKAFPLPLPLKTEEEDIACEMIDDEGDDELPAIDLVKYYGMQNENLDIDGGNFDSNVVFDAIARKSQ